VVSSAREAAEQALRDVLALDSHCIEARHNPEVLRRHRSKDEAAPKVEPTEAKAGTAPFY
jgi:hypothetical protein